MKIIELKSENVKRLRAVHIKPDGAVLGAEEGNSDVNSNDQVWGSSRLAR